MHLTRLPAGSRPRSRLRRQILFLPRAQVIAGRGVRRLIADLVIRLRRGSGCVLYPLISLHVAFQVAYVHRSACRFRPQVLEPVNERGKFLSHAERPDPFRRQRGRKLFASVAENVLASKHQIAHFVVNIPVRAVVLCFLLRPSGAQVAASLA